MYGSHLHILAGQVYILNNNKIINIDCIFLNEKSRKLNSYKNLYKSLLKRKENISILYMHGFLNYILL